MLHIRSLCADKTSYLLTPTASLMKRELNASGLIHCANLLDRRRRASAFNLLVATWARCTISCLLLRIVVMLYQSQAPLISLEVHDSNPDLDLKCDLNPYFKDLVSDLNTVTSWTWIFCYFVWHCQSVTGFIAIYAKLGYQPYGRQCITLSE